MLAYQLKLALGSLRRNPVLSSLLVTAIALGVSISTATVTLYHIYSSDPIPGKSDRLYHVELDSWGPDAPFSSRHPERAPTHITYRDMVAIMQSDIPTYQAGGFKAGLTVIPEGEGQRPYRELVRMCFGDLFKMFDAPFAFGSGWGRDADLGPEPVIVIDSATNDRLFGGEDSVGRSLRIEDRLFTIVGVLEPWLPTPKHYDPTIGAFDAPEGIFMPFAFTPVFEAYSLGNTWGWTDDSGTTFEEYLQSELAWIQMWVQLDDEAQKEAYQSFLDAYVIEQKAQGRFQRPLNNRLLTVMEYLEERNVVPRSTTGLVVVSLLFLIVCSVNLIGIMLGKFLARAPEVSVRRALGASRRSILVQHLVESELVGLLGGLVGLALSILVIDVVNRMLGNAGDLRLDLRMIAVGVALSLLSGLIAGAYPAWRICRVAPAAHLKTR
jgi:putative ABC transport system permease protein